MVNFITMVAQMTYNDREACFPSKIRKGKAPFEPLLEQRVDKWRKRGALNEVQHQPQDNKQDHDQDQQVITTAKEEANNARQQQRQTAIAAAWCGGGFIRDKLDRLPGGTELRWMGFPGHKPPCAPPRKVTSRPN